MQGFDKASSVTQITNELNITNGIVTAAIGTMWDSYADKALIAPRLQYFYTKRQAIDMLLGASFDSVDTETSGLKSDLSDEFVHLTKMRDACNEQINTLQANARSVRPPVVGLITAQTITQPLPNAPDPSNQAYRGSPIFGTLTSRG